jgi:hypothetical protein
LYWEPAWASAIANKFDKDPFAVAFLYDIAIMQGCGTDEDSLGTLCAQARGDLAMLMRLRTGVIAYATDPKSRDEWRRALDRMDDLYRLRHENPDLRGMVTVRGKTIKGL